MKTIAQIAAETRRNQPARERETRVLARLRLTLSLRQVSGRERHLVRALHGSSKVWTGYHDELVQVLDAYEALDAVAAQQRNELAALRGRLLGWKVIAELERLHAQAPSQAERDKLAEWIGDLRASPHLGWQYVRRAQDQGAQLDGPL